MRNPRPMLKAGERFGKVEITGHIPNKVSRTKYTIYTGKCDCGRLMNTSRHFVDKLGDNLSCPHCSTREHGNRTRARIPVGDVIGYYRILGDAPSANALKKYQVACVHCNLISTKTSIYIWAASRTRTRCPHCT